MNNFQSIPSPVTEKINTRVFDTIKASDIIKLYQDEFDIDVSEYFKDIDIVPIMECISTGYRFYYPSSAAGSGTFYEHFQKRFIDQEEWYRKWGYDYQFAYDRISPGESILDIGCGTGEFLKRIKEKSSNITGIELNSVAYEKCKAAGLTVYNETIQEYADKNEGKHDIVCIFQVLEHVYEIKSFLEAALKALKKGGKLIIGVPNNDPYFQGFDKYSTFNLPPHHMGLWNRNALTNLQENFGLLLNEVAYDKKSNWKIDAYFKAKSWLNITSGLRRHTFSEKLKLVLLAPITVPISIFRYATGRLQSGFIVAFYEKRSSQ